MKNLFSSLLLLFCTAFALVGQTNTAHTTIQQAPDFALYDLDENLISTSDYRGQFVVIHIATTWCPYCNAEAPALQKLSDQYADQDVIVMIIDVKEEQELVDRLLRQKHGLTFPILLDTDGSAAAKFAPPEVLPELARDEIMLASNILIDRQGQIQFMSLLDTRNFDAKLIHLREKLDRLLAQEPPSKS